MKISDREQHWFLQAISILNCKQASNQLIIWNCKFRLEINKLFQNKENKKYELTNFRSIKKKMRIIESKINFQKNNNSNFLFFNYRISIKSARSKSYSYAFNCRISILFVPFLNNSMNLFKKKMKNKSIIFIWKLNSSL